MHPALAAAGSRRRVFIEGGGDGLAAREVLRWADVEQIVLVDLDPEMTDLARHHPALSALNQRSLDAPRVHVENQDAMTYLRDIGARYDVVILDFPDPNNYSVGKLFSVELYREVVERLADRGTLAVQATSPFYAPSAYATIPRFGARRGVRGSPVPRLPSFVRRVGIRPRREGSGAGAAGELTSRASLPRRSNPAGPLPIPARSASRRGVTEPA